MDSVCRICLSIPGELLPLFENGKLINEIESISGIRLVPMDHLPLKICVNCVENVKKAYTFRNTIISSNIQLMHASITVGHNEAEDVKIVIPIKEESKDSNALDINEQIRDNSVMKSNNYVCEICGFLCHTFKDLRRHKKSHVKVMCTVCARYVRSDNLSKHMDTHGHYSIPCTECGKLLKNKESLRAHLLVHNRDKFTCEICGEIYSHRGNYRRHILKRHTPGYTLQAECLLCKKKFFDNSGLRKHMRSHTGEKPYPCPYCKNGFSSTNALNTHVRQHTHEKPYTCSFCPAAFHQKISLRTHLKSKHEQ